jgi:prophage antirepressor-like protein
MSTMIPFDFEDALVRVIDQGGEPWFVLSDACKVLDITNSRNATARLDDDEKGVHIMDTLGGPQEMTIISESGLYALIFRSRKPQAVRFRKWVTSEVLPTIRKTGSYSSDQVPPKHQELRMQDYFTLQRKYIAVLDELEFYRRDAEKWNTATAMIKAGIDDDTISTVLSVPMPYLEWVRCRAE